LIVGGGDNTYGNSTLASAELYDPTAGIFSATGSMITARGDHTATLLPNGQILAVGGVAGNALVSAELYTPNVSYVVTPSAGSNGSISPNTTQTIDSGATTSFTVTPNTGYSAAVGGTCGGTLIGTTYTTNAITADCTVAASFTINTYNISPSAGANGSISPNAVESVNYGTATNFTVTANTGYSASVGGTCGGTLVGTTYTTNAITTNCTVVASFTLNAYTVTPSAGANGSISPNTPQTVNYGATTSFTVTPNTGYSAAVGGTCGGALVGATYTTNVITSNCTVTASFTPPTCSASTSINANFNGTHINAGNFIWFNSNFNVSGLGSTPVTIFFTGQTVSSANFTTSLPDSSVTLDPAATTATTTYANGVWTTHVPSSGLAGNDFLSGGPYIVPGSGLPGGINPVTWRGVVSTNTHGLKLNWKWGAAIYTAFSGDASQLGVKPTDDNKASQYKNSDHAGTPENFKGFVTGGATGGGGSNYTGGWSGTASVVPSCSP
jgi:hypothetical protein